MSMKRLIYICFITLRDIFFGLGFLIVPAAILISIINSEILYLIIGIIAAPVFILISWGMDSLADKVMRG